jgi:putative FmdB family regulatory protein
LPIYEYRCANCGHKTSLFRLTIREAEAAEAGLKCERCGQPALRRLMSRFVKGKTGPTEGEELYEFDHLTANLDDADTHELDRFTQNLGGDPSGNEPTADE